MAPPLFLPPVTTAQVSKLKDFELDSKPDRGVLFDMAVSPANDVLSFVAKDTGDWKLYRASNWLGEAPLVKSIVLPGYFSKRDSRKGDKSLEHMSAKVFVTRYGSYAVCLGSAAWLKRVNGRAVGSATSNDVISVVDLSTFEVIATVQTEGLDLFEFHEIVLDDDGYIRVGSSSPGSKHGAFVRLSIPLLKAGPRCAYDWIVDSPGNQHPQPTSNNECDEAIQSSSLGDYLHEGQAQSPKRTDVCENNSSKFCHIPGEFTADGKFGVGSSIKGHDNILGRWVITDERLIIFSSARRMDVGEIKEPTNDISKTTLTSLDGRDYLLVIRSGTHLTIYQLRD
jgi:hypothetical protein